MLIDMCQGVKLHPGRCLSLTFFWLINLGLGILQLKELIERHVTLDGIRS